MVLVKLILTWLSFFVVLSSGLPYLIFLNGSTTIETVNSYINRFEPHHQFRAYVKSSFTIGTLSGFTGDFSKAVIKRLKQCPFISDVTPDIIVRANGNVVEEEAPRHLARLSQRKTLKGTEFEYCYDEDASGQGVNAYVIDSGIRIDHPQFEGRARHGIDLTPEGANDYNGHGTHVAGLIGSTKYGVSKNVELVSVKALDRFGSGSLSMIISAIEFAVKDMNQSGKKGVANLSLGAAKNRALNRVVDAAVDAGLVIVVAAGNENSNACGTSPASAEKAITVGSIDDLDDTLAPFTNWGSCVDIFASGKFIASANIRNSDVPLILSGTSMSAPQVAGLAANALSGGVECSQVKKYIIKNSTRRTIPRTSIVFKFRTPNRIAFNYVEEGDDDDDSDFADLEDDFDGIANGGDNEWESDDFEEKEFELSNPLIIVDYLAL